MNHTIIEALSWVPSGSAFGRVFNKWRRSGDPHLLAEVKQEARGNESKIASALWAKGLYIDKQPGEAMALALADLEGSNALAVRSKEAADRVDSSLARLGAALERRARR